MEIIRIKPFEQVEMVKAIASVYQKSFGGKPWNEGYVCPECRSVFPLTSVIKTCPMCAERSMDVLVVEYWPISKIISDFYREMRKATPVCVVARSNAEIVGFAWGYQVSVNPSLSEHLDAPKLCELLRGEFFYIDECALLPSHQGKGIGKLLVNRLCQEQHQGKVLLRTMNDSRMYNLIKKMGGEIVQHISHDRCIMHVLT